MIRFAPSFALMMKTMFPVTARPVQTPTGSEYISCPGPSAMPSLLVSVKRRSSPYEAQYVNFPLGLLVATRMEPSDNRASPFGKFNPEANVVIRKSFGSTRGSPPIVNCAAAGATEPATRAETQTASATRDRTRRMVCALLLPAIGPCLSQKQNRLPNRECAKFDTFRAISPQREGVWYCDICNGLRYPRLDAPLRPDVGRGRDPRLRPGRRRVRADPPRQRAAGPEQWRRLGGSGAARHPRRHRRRPRGRSPCLPQRAGLRHRAQPRLRAQPGGR